MHWTDATSTSGPGNSTDKNIYYTTVTAAPGKPSTTPASGVNAIPAGQMYFDFNFKVMWIYDGAAWYGMQFRAASAVTSLWVSTGF